MQFFCDKSVNHMLSTFHHSPESMAFRELQTFVGSLHEPYHQADIVKFIQLYQRNYSQLSLEEKQQSERFVDLLAADVEKLELTYKIWGVA